MRFGAAWCTLCNLVQIDTVLCNLVQFGTTWNSLLLELGAVWCNLVQHVADWFNFVLTGATHCRLVQLGVSGAP